MWLCLETLFVWIRKKKRGDFCDPSHLSEWHTEHSLQDRVSHLPHWVQSRIGDVLRIACVCVCMLAHSCVCDLSLIWVAVTVMFLSVPHCPSAFPPQSHCHLAAVSLHLCLAPTFLQCTHTHTHRNTHLLDTYSYSHQKQIRIRKAGFHCVLF